MGSGWTTVSEDWMATRRLEVLIIKIDRGSFPIIDALTFWDSEVAKQTKRIEKIKKYSYVPSIYGIEHEIIF